MNSTIKDLLERRSIRKYKLDQITNEELNTILEVATYAPSGMNSQSAIMVVLQNKEDIAHVARLNAAVIGKEFDPFYEAPTIVTVFGDSTKHTFVEDGCLVMGNLMNAASAIGVGSCWIHRAKEAFGSDEGKELLKKWGIDEKYVGIGHCLLGYPKGENPKAAPRKEGYIHIIHS